MGLNYNNGKGALPLENYYNTDRVGINQRFFKVGFKEGDDVTYGLIVVRAVVQGTIPLMLMHPELYAVSKRGYVITDDTCKTFELIRNGDIYIYDDVYETRYGVERFIFITEMTNPINMSPNHLYYDRLHKDIIVVPDIRHLNNKDGVITREFTYSINIARIGGGGAGDLLNLDSFVPEGHDKSRIILPETNSFIRCETAICGINGCDVDTAFKNIDLFDSVPGTDSEVVRGEIVPATVVDLGKASDLFKEYTNDIPLYNVAKFSPERFNMQYIGPTDPKDRHIYISFSI